MKLAKLLLQAFGPFTDAMLDFSEGKAGLHLVYGPNEAGKSSALRAITDLRFGIPARSPDDFVHPFSQMRIAGVFQNGQGEALGFVRRKGNKATLSRLDPDSLQPDPDLPVLGEHELALTSGLGREEFEAMFGLNHARLREGGGRLLKGEGELGSALFEASAGVRGIAAILAELDADAKKLFNPHGAAKSATINEARRQLDEQRHALRHAQTKPAEWQSLHRAHVQAKDALDGIDRQLEAERRRERELAELRGVEPLLREQDRLLAALDGLAAAPGLPEAAREERLAAEHALRHAAQQRQEAEAELARCELELAGLIIEAPLLEHAGAVERLAAALDPAARARLQARQQQADIAHRGAELEAAAARLGPGAERALPGPAERKELDHHLEQIGKLGERLRSQRQQAEVLERELKRQREETAAPPDPAARRALNLALSQARALGEVEKQAETGGQRLRELDGQLAQALADLGGVSLETLRAARPLLEAETAQARQHLEEIDRDGRTLRDEDGRLARDLQEQTLRRRQLEAEGEIVTADTLKQARANRDERWQRLRRAWLEPDGGAPGAALADDFEAAQAEADRQADLLRADALRAAAFAECAARIGQMEERRAQVAAELRTLAGRGAALQAAWTEKLAQAGLPALGPEALREWQSRRQAALALAAQRDAAQAGLERLLNEARAAEDASRPALAALGQEATGRLADLIEQAAAWEKAATEAQARQAEREDAARKLEARREDLARQLEATAAELERHQARLREWHGRLFLDPDSPPAALKARLDELDGLARQAAALAEARLALAQSQTVVDDFAEQARQLAGLLGEPEPAQADDFAERLRGRLSLSKEAEAQRKSLERERAKAEAQKRQAGAELARQTAELARLCRAAGVEDAALLPEQEALAGQKRQTREALAQVRQQLAQASPRPLPELRAALAGRDAIALDAEREQCGAEAARLEQEQAAARGKEEQTRRALEAVDASDQAARAREAMEAAAARCRAALRPWARLRLAHALLGEALNRFRERAQAPMVAAASEYFALMTGGRYLRLVADEQDGRPVLRALREDGAAIGVEAMSEGTADQLYLALRLAALELRRAAHPAMPLVLDDVLITSDDRRAANILKALARFAEGGQVLLFTHHRHLLELAGEALRENMAAHTLAA